jgi:hypothetical protein
MNNNFKSDKEIIQKWLEEKKTENKNFNIASYDFGEELPRKSPYDADRRKIIRILYCLLWESSLDLIHRKGKVRIMGTNRLEYSGDTLNTYKSPIVKFNGKLYVTLTKNRKRNKEILKELETSFYLHGITYDKKTNVSNNHMLGNFMPMPCLRDSLNVKRNSPFGNYPHDFFDLYLLYIKKFAYNENLSESESIRFSSKPICSHLVSAIKNNSNNKGYLEKFKSFNNYIKLNFLDDYLINKKNKNFFTRMTKNAFNFKNGDIIPLYHLETFSDYAKVLVGTKSHPETGVILKRGTLMKSQLEKLLDIKQTQKE